MSQRFWPSSQSILPIIPRRLTPLPAVPVRTPEVPFFQLAEHRLPTLWSLYRPLLRGLRGVLLKGDRQDQAVASNETTKRLRSRWRRARKLTSPATTRAFLEKEYELLQRIDAASNGHEACRTALVEAELLLRASTAARQERLRSVAKSSTPNHPPRLSPRPLRASLFNRPLPRLKPQPLGISMMINKRIRARENRHEKQGLHWGYIEMMRSEEAFWRNVGARHAPSGGWPNEHRQHLQRLQQSFELDKARSEAQIEPELVERCITAGKNRDRQLAERAERRKAKAKQSTEK